MKRVTELLGDLMLISNDDLGYELKKMKSSTITAFKEQLARLNKCTEFYEYKENQHKKDIQEVKQMINEYGITISELHQIEQDLTSGIEKDINQNTNISSRIQLEQFLSSFKNIANNSM